MTTTSQTQSPAELRHQIAQLDKPLYVLNHAGRTMLSNKEQGNVIASLPPLPIARLGAADFRHRYKTHWAYMGGAMAGGIASTELVTALASIGCLGSYGAAGLPPARVDAALAELTQQLQAGSFAVNLIHSPHEAELERTTVDAAIRHGVTVIEASAFMDLTPEIVRYRAHGIAVDNGKITTPHKIIAKVSRTETASKFLNAPAPQLINHLIEHKHITEQQAQLLARIPLADNITVEGDSGGHTDRRPLATTFSAIAAERDSVAKKFTPARAVGLGAAGGIATPAAIAAAYALGADYVVAGTIHQACIESGTSNFVRQKLADATIADVTMAPAADMFEMGVELQVLRRGTMFPMRAAKLYETYRKYNGLNEIPRSLREEIEQKYLRNSFDTVWSEVEKYFASRDAGQLDRARNNEKRKMALVFRWYLGNASRWATSGNQERSLDYQVWTGPGIGAFNAWTNGSSIANPDARTIAKVVPALMRSAAYQLRIQLLAANGVSLPTSVRSLPATESLNA